tara:strand:+ start:418 stop:1011 length:594 start_codon:yes stop_codon:yes gene_type:complete
MSFRSEKKYKLSYGDSFKIKSQLISLGMKKLFPDREIHSEYLDTKELKMFSDSEEGILPRKKIRIRWYKDKSIQNLETKISSVEGRYKKSEKFSKLERKKNFYLHDTFYGKIFSSIIVNYKREYYQFKNLRLTFDTKINYFNSRYKSLIKYNDKETVLEVKTKNLYADDYINQIIYYPTSRFSKYSRGVLLTNAFLN